MFPLINLNQMILFHHLLLAVMANILLLAIMPEELFFSKLGKVSNQLFPLQPKYLHIMPNLIILGVN